ncbi:MAG: N-acetyltransferase [Prevotella sp.]|nr:N-acetyltransferase [Prevotella sp.]
MNEVKVIEVKSRQQMNDFISIPSDVYRGNGQYVPDLEGDVPKLFDPKSNSALDFSDIQPFVAYRDNIPVGRIVGIVNRKANDCWHTHNVRFSMIEFVDDLAVSKALIAAVEDWGSQRGMDTIQGPMGITDFDKEGMLVEDFDMIGSVNTIYNPDYYPRHMEALGFQKEVDWLQVHIQIPREVPAKYARVAQYAREQIGLRVVKLTSRQLCKEGYGQRVFELLNESYKSIFGFSPLSSLQVDEFLHKYLPVVDLQLIPVVLNDKNEVVGVAITMGSLSHPMQKAHGRMFPFGWFHLLKALKWHREDNAEMLLIAIRPDYQGLGVNAMFFDDLIPIYNQYGFRWAETGPQLENNVRELSQWKPLKPEYVKRRRCYTRKIKQ